MQTGLGQTVFAVFRRNHFKTMALQKGLQQVPIVAVIVHN